MMKVAPAVLQARSSLPILFLCSALAYLVVRGGLLAPPVQAQESAVPELTGRIVDNADLLSPATERMLTDRLHAHEDSTSNQVAVLTIESLNGAVLEEYSLNVARTWALGHEEFDNGVLLLVAHDDREVRIEVGYGLEGDLPDATASRIIRNEIVPAFRDGDFDGGIQDGVEAILGTLEGTYSPSRSRSGILSAPTDPFNYLVLFLTMIVAGGLGCAIALAIIGSAARSGWPRGIVVTLILLPFATATWSPAFVSFSALLIPDPPFTIPLIFTLVTLVAIVGYSIWLIRHPKLRRLREKAKAGESIRQTVSVGWLAFPPEFWTPSSKLEVFGNIFTLSKAESRSGSSRGSSSSSGSSSFSGGGGSFGGGGASGSW